jgi:hypothetical protein
MITFNAQYSKLWWYMPLILALESPGSLPRPCLKQNKVTKNIANIEYKTSMMLAYKQTHTSMEQKRKPKFKNLWWINFVFLFVYVGSSGGTTYPSHSFVYAKHGSSIGMHKNPIVNQFETKVSRS